MRGGARSGHLETSATRDGVTDVCYAAAIKELALLLTPLLVVRSKFRGFTRKGVKTVQLEATSRREDLRLKSG